VRSEILIGLAALVVGGCASQNLSIRVLPAETPAADNAAAIRHAAVLAAAAAGASERPLDQNSANAAPALTKADAPSMFTYDPFERLNRFTYRFNARFDEAVFLPVANGYRRVPTPMRSGVHNFFDNLSEVKTVINYALQLRFGGAAPSLGRFLINSTLGIGGLFDVATKLNVKAAATGFSTTLSKWGVHPGAYLVIPFLGPSTLRDGAGLLGNFGIAYAVDMGGLYRGEKTWILGVVDAIDLRANTSFRYYGTGSPFEYETVRFLYVRKVLIEDEALRAKHARTERNVGVPAGR
jgi:phospholipid-binding lipoprotein MlaA